MTEIPKEISDAAEKVRVWAESNGLKYWQLGGICDRRYAKHLLDKKLAKMAREDEAWERFMRMS